MKDLFPILGLSAFFFFAGIVVSCGEGPPGPFDEDSVSESIDRLTEVVRDKQCACAEDDE